MNRHDVVDSDLTRIEPPRPPAPATPPARHDGAGDMASSPGVRAPCADRDRAAQRLSTSASTSARSSPSAPTAAIAFSVGDPDAALLSRGRRLKPLQADGDARRRARPATRPARPRVRQPRRHTVTTSRASGGSSPAPASTSRRSATRPTSRSSRCAAADCCAAGGERRAVQMNCSGKHAGMLATCVVNGWSTSRLPRPDPSAAARDHGDGRGAGRRGRPHRRRRVRRPGARALAARPGGGVRDDRRSTATPCGRR